jgi:hypothetical protein
MIILLRGGRKKEENVKIKTTITTKGVMRFRQGDGWR